MPTLLEAFDGLPDPRMERTRLHALRDIVILSILAVICGADGFVHIEDVGKAKEDWLGKALDLPNGIPSHAPSGGCSRCWTRRRSRPASWRGSGPSLSGSRGRSWPSTARPLGGAWTAPGIAEG